MESWFRKGLLPLYNVLPLFSSSDPHEAKLGTTGAFKEHDLVWHNGKIDSALYQAHIGALSFYILRYGAAVHITPGELEHFMLFQVPISGTAKIQVGQTVVQASERTGVIISPTLPLQLNWSEGCEQMLLKIPRKRIELACRALLGADLNEPIEFSPEFSLDSVSGQAWQHQISALLCHLGNPHYPLPGQWVHVQEEALIHHLLLCQKSNYTDRLMHQPAMTPRRVRLAQEYIQSHLQEPLTLASIAQASGTSVRSLCVAFQDHYQLSPMTYVRNTRMEAARQELIEADPGTRVTDIAFRWGFNHLGRFCSQYRLRYGETPMQSLKR